MFLCFDHIWIVDSFSRCYGSSFLLSECDCWFLSVFLDLYYFSVFSKVCFLINARCFRVWIQFRWKAFPTDSCSSTSSLRMVKNSPLSHPFSRVRATIIFSLLIVNILSILTPSSKPWVKGKLDDWFNWMIATICSPLVGSQKRTNDQKRKELKKPVMKALTFDNQYIIIWL